MARLAILLPLIVLAGCNRGPSARLPLRIGVTPIPAGEVMARLVPELAVQGVEVTVVPFTDYIQPNMALASGDLDANLYQHEPFMKQFNRDHGTDLVAVTKVYVAPLALYPGRAKSLAALLDGARIALPNDPINLGRGLRLLESAGLVTLRPDSSNSPTVHSIAGNPRHLQFTELEAAQIPRSLPDVDAAVINANYALNAGLNPVRQSLLREREDSLYANVLAANRGRERDSRLLAVARALTSEATRQFLETRYQGAVIPAF